MFRIRERMRARGEGLRWRGDGADGREVPAVQVPARGPALPAAGVPLRRRTVPAAARLCSRPEERRLLSQTSLSSVTIIITIIIIVIIIFNFGKFEISFHSSSKALWETVIEVYVSCCSMLTIENVDCWIYRLQTARFFSNWIDVINLTAVS